MTKKWFYVLGFIGFVIQFAGLLILGGVLLVSKWNLITGYPVIFNFRVGTGRVLEKKFGTGRVPGSRRTLYCKYTIDAETTKDLRYNKEKSPSLENMDIGDKIALKISAFSRCLPQYTTTRVNSLFFIKPSMVMSWIFNVSYNVFIQFSFDEIAQSLKNFCMSAFIADIKHSHHKLTHPRSEWPWNAEMQRKQRISEV